MVFVYWTYKVSKLGYGRTKWIVTMYSINTAHINSNWSHFLMALFLVYWTYKVCSWYALDYYRVSVKVTIYTAHISLNRRQFLPAGFLEYWPYKVSKFGSHLFSYALQPAKHTSTSFMCAILEECLVMHPQRSMNLRPNITSYPVCIEEGGGNDRKLGFW